MKRVLLSATVALTLATSVQADFLGAEAGYAAWMPSISGTIKGEGILDVDINLENDLGYGEKNTNNFYWVYFDHFLPLIPNIKVQQTNFSTSSSIATDIRFDGKHYKNTVASELTLNQTDVIAYYRILDNWVNLDLGINIKVIDGNVKFDDNSVVAETDKNFKGYIPMAYAKARFDLPFTGLSVEADASYIGYSGSKFTDMKAGVVYETSYGLGILAGYRILNLTIDNVGGIYSDIDLKGAYAGLFYHF